MFGVEPDLTREGGSIPFTLTFQNATGCSVMLLPVGACDDGAHSQNEKFDRFVQIVSNFRSGIDIDFLNKIVQVYIIQNKQVFVKYKIFTKILWRYADVFDFVLNYF